MKNPPPHTHTLPITFQKMKLNISPQSTACSPFIHESPTWSFANLQSHRSTPHHLPSVVTCSLLLILLRKHETQGPDLLGCQGVGRASRPPVCTLICYRGGFFLRSLWLELSTRTGHCCRLLAVCAEQGPWPEGEMGS